MKITHITIAVDGEVTVKHADIDTSLPSVLKYLGVEELDPMSTYRVQPGPTGSTIIVELAQEKQWTWVKHIIVTT